MNYTMKFEKELNITTQDVIDSILCCEDGGFDYWCELCSNPDDYTAAKNRLVQAVGASMSPCYEDVLAEIMEHGGTLTVYDREDDKDYELTMEKLMDGWKKHVEATGRDDIDKYDAADADCILQLAVFGEVIYG